MKGYFEERGVQFQISFDPGSGEFVSRPIAHAFDLKMEQSQKKSSGASITKMEPRAIGKGLLVQDTNEPPAAPDIKTKRAG